MLEVYFYIQEDLIRGSVVWLCFCFVVFLVC